MTAPDRARLPQKEISALLKTYPQLPGTFPFLIGDAAADQAWDMCKAEIVAWLRTRDLPGHGAIAYAVLEQLADELEAR